MIFAKLDVCFDSHPRFLRLALSGDEGKVACAYWVAVLTFLRRNDSPDGVIAISDVGMPLQFGDELARKLCERLVDASLFERHERGYLLLRYAEKNETREQIEERRAANRDRVAKHRAKRARRKKKGSGGHDAVPPITPDSVTYYPHDYKPTGVTRDSRVAAGSGSDSGSVSSPPDLPLAPGGSGGLAQAPLTLVDVGDPVPPRDELAAVFDEWVERRAVRTLGTMAAAAARNKSTDPRFSAERRKLLARWTRAGYTAETLRLAVRGLVADNTLVNGRTPKWQDVRSFSWMLESQDQLDSYVEAGAEFAKRERERSAARTGTNGAAAHEAPSGVVAVAPAAAEPQKSAGGAA